MHISKTPITNNRRRHAAADALASVRAEGLEPSASVIRRLKLYSDGVITADQLRKETLDEVKADHK